jgi:hypothetical protein
MQLLDVKEPRKEQNEHILMLPQEGSNEAISAAPTCYLSGKPLN